MNNWARASFETLGSVALLTAGVLVPARFACGQITSTDTPSTANDIRVTLTNEGNSSFTLTPLWFGFHDGNFDLFDVGAAASASLESLAEDGNVDGVVGDFTASGPMGDRQGVVFAPGGFGGAPVVEPGESDSAYITLSDEAMSPYFSFASMVIPSNDAFLGNSDPMAYMVFDGANNIVGGSVTISVFAEGLYDAGTEDNTGMGAPFSMIGGMATDTVDGVVGAAGDLSEFLNSDTLAGTTITDLIAPGSLVATITISRVPEPSTVVLAAFGAGCALVLARRRR